MSNNIKLLLISLVLFLIGGFFIYFGINSSTVKVLEIQEIQETPPEVNLEKGSVMQKTLVTKVVDGDTIEVEGGFRIRYIGIDTPETVDPRRPVGCF
ncbi:MAG: hypothetical protein Q7S88_01000, partial [Candidatus Daviesbacteria bacterium]|nr:hypothetical protein [Candidatus Daviesbacteria bacterium]